MSGTEKLNIYIQTPMAGGEEATPVQRHQRRWRLAASWQAACWALLLWPPTPFRPSGSLIQRSPAIAGIPAPATATWRSILAALPYRMQC